jgi:hypothetical protein
LIKTLRGRSGLSDRQVRALLQVVFDKALESMRIEGRAVHEMESLKVALNRPGFFRHSPSSLRNAFQTLPGTADC